MHKKQEKRSRNTSKGGCAGSGLSSPAHNQHPRKTTSNSKEATQQTQITPAHFERSLLWARTGIEQREGIQDAAWPQQDRINWTNQRYLEHKRKAHAKRPEPPSRCRSCRDYEIWLAREEEKQTWGYIATSFAMPRSSVREAWGRIDKNIPASRLTEEPPAPNSTATELRQPQPTYDPNSQRCSCGAIVQAATPELARNALAEHVVLVHGKD
jgi:hypothetical protein